MTISTIIDALALPSGCRVEQRVPKKLLLENGAPTAADRRQINDGIEDLHWIAALKPTTIGVSEYRDAVREYVEIAVLSIKLRVTAKVNRLTELVHRAIPYPVLLITEHGGEISLSVAHVRCSQSKLGKTVVDGDVVAVKVYGENNEAFFEALALARQPRTTLYALYQGWLDTLTALQAMHLTGSTFAPVSSLEHSMARRNALQKCARLEIELARLRTAAVKEKQLSRQVEINLEIKRLQAEYAAASAGL